MSYTVGRGAWAPGSRPEGSAAGPESHAPACPTGPGEETRARPHLGPPPRDVLPKLGQRRGQIEKERGLRGGESGVPEEVLRRLLDAARPHLRCPGLPSAARGLGRSRFPAAPPKGPAGADPAERPPAPPPNKPTTANQTRRPCLSHAAAAQSRRTQRAGFRARGRYSRSWLSRGCTVDPALLLFSWGAGRTCSWAWRTLRPQHGSSRAA